MKNEKIENKSYLELVLNSIEENISEKIRIEQISSECFVSARQLYRDFYSYTGHSVHEYIRKRRLSKALSLLKYSSMSLARIANECGYSSQQAFCTSIKNAIGMTPLQYVNNTDVYYFPVCDEQLLKQITVQTKTIPDMIRINFLCSSLIGIENKAIQWLQSKLPNYKGKLLGRNGTQQGKNFCYELYIEYNIDFLNLLKNLEFKDITLVSSYTGFFAQISTKNDELSINHSWNFLYGHWLKNSMFEQDDIPYFEEYIIKNNCIVKLILHLPIKQKENFYKIKIEDVDDRLFLISTKTGFNAENSAVHELMNFVSFYHPHFFSTQKKVYICKSSNTYSCGINLPHPISTPKTGVHHLHLKKGIYAVLEGSCLKNSEEYEKVLVNWLKNSGIKTEGDLFSVYDINNGTDKKNIIVKSQVKIKHGRKI